jgi:hypothetical protein
MEKATFTCIGDKMASMYTHVNATHLIHGNDSLDISILQKSNLQ